MLCIWICSWRAFRGCLYASIVNLYFIKPKNKANLYKIVAQSIVMHVFSCLHILPGLDFVIEIQIFIFVYHYNAMRCTIYCFYLASFFNLWLNLLTWMFSLIHRNSVLNEKASKNKGPNGEFFLNMVTLLLICLLV